MIRKKITVIFLFCLLSISAHGADQKNSIRAFPPYPCDTRGEETPAVDCAHYKLPAGDCKKYSKHYSELKFYTPDAGCFMEPNSYKNYLPILECGKNQLLIEGKLSSGKTVKLVMKRKAFSHKIKRNDQGALVNGAPAYGAEAEKPYGEFAAFELSVDGQKIEIPAKAYQNFFEPGGRDGFGSPNYKNKKIINCGVTVIESKDKKHFYVYMNGSDAAGAYAVKWVFEPSKFITYILDPASDNSSWATVDGVQY